MPCVYYEVEMKFIILFNHNDDDLPQTLTHIHIKQ